GAEHVVAAAMSHLDTRRVGRPTGFSSVSQPGKGVILGQESDFRPTIAIRPFGNESGGDTGSSRADDREAGFPEFPEVYFGRDFLMERKFRVFPDFMGDA